MDGLFTRYSGSIRRSFHSGPLNRKLFRLASPVFLAMISHTMVMVSDTAMVGRLGSDALAATGLGGMSFWTLLSFLFGGSMGVQIITARRIGEKKHDAAGQALQSAIVVTVFLALLLIFPVYLIAGRWMNSLSSNSTVADLATDFLHLRLEGAILFFLTFILTGFFDGLGKTKITMFASITMAVANILFNWIFIYGHFGVPALGVKGAAISSNLAGGTSILVFIFFLMHREFRRYAGQFSKPFDFASIREILYISFPPGMENFLINVAFLLFYRIAGDIGTVSVASTNIVVAVMSISFMPGFSFGIAATTLLGQAMGAGKNSLARQSVYRAALFSAITMGSIGITFIILGQPLLGLFTSDETVIADALPALILVALIQVGDAYHMVIGSALRGAGLVYWVMGVYAVVSYLVMLPMAYILGVFYELGTIGLWSAFSLWIVLLAFLFLRKFQKGDWKKGEV